ncbi:MAG: hypothetical protein ACRDN9_01370 [Streptosporangiaceae bacterium]
MKNEQHAVSRATSSRTAPEVLAVAAGSLLDEAERRTIGGLTRARGWSAADAVLVDEAADIVERVPSVGHVVLDEAQDLTPMQYRAVGRRCRTGSLTVLGDLAQGTSPWATESWELTLAHLGKPAARVEALRRGYRVPHQVITYASRLLPSIAAGLEPPIPVREAAAEPRGLRRLYVVLTRAVSGLTVVHSADLPGPLAAAEP